MENTGKLSLFILMTVLSQYSTDKRMFKSKMLHAVNIYLTFFFCCFLFDFRFILQIYEQIFFLKKSLISLKASNIRCNFKLMQCRKETSRKEKSYESLRTTLRFKVWRKTECGLIRSHCCLAGWWAKPSASLGASTNANVISNLFFYIVWINDIPVHTF